MVACDREAVCVHPGTTRRASGCSVRQAAEGRLGEVDIDLPPAGPMQQYFRQAN